LNGKDRAFIVNTIMEKVRQWYTVEWVSIDGDSVAIQARIGGVYFDCFLIGGEVWINGPSRSRIETNLMNHLNGILSGKVRNDAGELVNP